MLYTSDGESLCNNIIDHRLVLDGLKIGNIPLFINLWIDTANRHATTHGSSDYKPSVETLGCFRGRSGTAKAVNVIERIGCKYFVFGVQLLNDEHGSFIEAIENELHHDSTRIISRILREWSNGRENAKPFEWYALIDTLKDIGLNTLAEEIKNTL